MAKTKLYIFYTSGARVQMASLAVTWMPSWNLCDHGLQEGFEKKMESLLIHIADSCFGLISVV